MPVSERRPAFSRASSQVRSCLAPDSVASRPRFADNP